MPVYKLNWFDYKKKKLKNINYFNSFNTIIFFQRSDLNVF